MVPLELIAIAPLGAYIGNAISGGIDGFFAVGGIFAGALLGFFRPILVMFGMHYSLIPIQIQQIGQQGFTLLMPSALAANFAQAGAALGVFFLTKNKSMKSVAGSSALSAAFGITEPAIYGVNLKYKRPFFASCFAAAIASGFYIIVNAKTVAMGLPGLLSLANNQADKFIYIIIGVIMATGLSFIFTLIAGINEDDEDDEDENEYEEDINVKKDTMIESEVTIMTPIAGEVRDLAETNDNTFAQELIGKGIAIMPSNGKVYAPFNGFVEALFKSKHAIGLRADNGIELLVHIGMDTVNLEGKYFTSHVKQGQKITAGELLIEFDMKAIEEEGYNLITPVVITNSNEYSDVSTIANGTIKEREALLKVLN
jgi:PTS system beta-glucosides-specific IIC component